MTGIFFYSILIFILLSIFVPSIYTYAYKCFIGRVVLVLLIIYFSKHNLILGLIFVTIIVITSYPLYEGFSENDILAKNLLVTSNYSINDKTNNQEVFNYFTKYYCQKGSSLPNQEKTERWSQILNDQSSDSNSKDVALYNLLLQELICSTPSTPITTWKKPSVTFQELDDTNCVYGRIPYPGASSDNYKYLGDFDSYDQCTQATNIPSNAKAITYHNANIGGYARQCYSINDNNTIVPNQYYATCGIINTDTIRSPAPDTSQYYINYNNNWNAAFPNGYNPLDNSINPSTIDGCSYNNSNYILNTPSCLSKNIQNEICNNQFTQDTISSAQNISNNSELDPYLQQDGQWLLNMYGQLCTS